MMCDITLVKKQNASVQFSARRRNIAVPLRDYTLCGNSFLTAARLNATHVGRYAPECRLPRRYLTGAQAEPL